MKPETSHRRTITLSHYHFCRKSAGAMATRQQASSSRRASQLSQQRTSALPPLDTRGEMFQKGQHGSFFDMKALAPRPMSSSTDIYDTEFEDDGSEIEEGDYSPRISINSVCVPVLSRGVS